MFVLNDAQQFTRQHWLNMGLQVLGREGNAGDPKIIFSDPRNATGKCQPLHNIHSARLARGVERVQLGRFGLWELGWVDSAF